MITLALACALFLSPPAWVNQLQLKAQTIIRADKHPLTVKRVESMIQGLLPSSVQARIIPVNGGPEQQFIISALNPPMESGAILIGRDRRLLIVDWSREESDRPSCEVTQAELRDGMLIVGGKLGWVGNGPGFLIRTMVQRQGVWETRSSAASTRQCDSCLWSKVGNTYRVRTCDYPPHMSTGHADAVYSREETFAIRNGTVSRTGERPMATPFNALDELAGALAHHRDATVRRIVPSDALRKRLAVVWKAVGPEPGISIPGSTFNPGSVTWGWHSLEGHKAPDYWFNFVRRNGPWIVSRIRASYQPSGRREKPPRRLRNATNGQRFSGCTLEIFGCTERSWARPCAKSSLHVAVTI